MPISETAPERRDDQMQAKAHQLGAILLGHNCNTSAVAEGDFQNMRLRCARCNDVREVSNMDQLGHWIASWSAQESRARMAA